MLQGVNDWLLALCVTTLAIGVCSGLLYLHPRIPLRWVRMHTIVVGVPAAIALIALFKAPSGTVAEGFWRPDRPGWLMAGLILTIGWAVERYTVRYMFGDRAYRTYFALLTFTTAVSAVAWLCNDLRGMLVGWGLALAGMTGLMGANTRWPVARKAAARAGFLFACGWLALSAAVIWLRSLTGSWRLNDALGSAGLAHLGSMERTILALLLVIAAIIPASQWPFHRWLLDSVVVPTPVSAVMHAGFVNAGGILLLRFAPAMDQGIAQTALLLAGGFSIWLGTGIQMVQADYKRQLVASTIAQMGFMLVQCALGAYDAALIHLLLHGMFKATLFLQAGSAVARDEPAAAPGGSDSSVSAGPGNDKSSPLWTLLGGVLGLAMGVSYGFAGPGSSMRLLSAIILGWSLAIAWTQLLARNRSVLSRAAGLVTLLGAAIVYGGLHAGIASWLQGAAPLDGGLSLMLVLPILALFLSGGLTAALVARRRSSPAFATLYLRLVRWGEPRTDAVENHPFDLNPTMR